MEITLAQVQKALFSYLAHYPESGHNGETLKMIAFDYFEDMQEEKITASEFDAAVKHARRTCSFFPKVVDIIKSCRELRANPQRRTVAFIEEKSTVDTPEMIEAGKRNCQIIAQMLRKEITQEDAHKLMKFTHTVQ